MMIYLITNTVNGKQYVGMTIRTLKQRWTNHCCDSRNPKTALHNAIAKHGKAAFTIEQIGTAENIADLQTMEKNAIIARGTWAADGKGYNETFGGIGFHGQHSDKTKAKMSVARRGKVQSHLIGNTYRLGKPQNEKTKAAIAKACIGRVHSEEEKQKRKASMALIERMPWWGTAISAGKKGKPGKPWTDEMRAKRAGLKKQPMSAEHKARISEGRRAWFARKCAAKEECVA